MLNKKEKTNELIMKKLEILLLAIITCVACDREPEYAVHPDFEPYVQKFIDEGANYGKSFDFHKSGLIIEYADLSDLNLAGLCHNEDPIRIEINKTSWQSYSEIINEELYKEELIFHELGHGILDREHKNSLFPNGDWCSMMRGSYTNGVNAELPDSRLSWNTNYHGFRRDYYLDELFDSNTGTPEWANLQPVFDDDTEANIVFIDNFTSNINNWRITASEDNLYELVSGYYKVQTCTNKGYYYAKEINIDTTQNFYVQLKIKFMPQGNNDDYHNAGLVWGGNKGENLYYLSFTKDKRITIGNYINIGWYIELPCPEINADDYNIIELRKIEDIFYFSINGKFIYHTDHDGFFGNLVGFRLSGNSTVMVDKLQISYLGTTTKSGSNKVSVSDKTFIDVTPEIKLPN